MLSRTARIGASLRMTMILTALAAASSPMWATHAYSAVPGKVARMLDRGHVGEAIRLLEERDQKRPGDPEVYLKLADIYRDFTSVRDPRKELFWLAKARSTSRAAGQAQQVAEITKRVAKVEKQVDNLDFEDAHVEGTEASYQTYMTLHPAGAHVRAASEAVQDIRADRALGPGTELAYMNYLASEDGQSYHRRAEVIEKLYDIAMDEALEDGTEGAILSYVKRYPSSPRVEEAEQALFEMVVKSTAGSEADGYAAYLAKYGDRLHAHAQRYIDDAYRSIYAFVDKESEAQVEAYIEQFPEATNLGEAFEALFAAVSRQNSESKLAIFVKKYPKCSLRGQAEARVLETFYDATDPGSLMSFAAKYPDWETATIAEKSAWEIAFDRAEREDTKSAYQRFVKNYPGAPQVGDANRKIRRFTEMEEEAKRKTRRREELARKLRSLSVGDYVEVHQWGDDKGYGGQVMAKSGDKIRIRITDSDCLSDSMFGGVWCNAATCSADQIIHAGARDRFGLLGDEGIGEGENTGWIPTWCITEIR